MNCHALVLLIMGTKTYTEILLYKKPTYNIYLEPFKLCKSYCLTTSV